MVEIPLTNTNGAYQFNITLDGNNYIFSVQYNRRMSRWSLSIYDSENNPLVLSIPLLVNIDLIKQFRYKDKMLKGTLFVVNMEEDHKSPEREDLGETCYLMYEGVTE